MTRLTEVKGGLLSLDVPALGHGCNCRGSMRGGVARQVRARWPALYVEYRDRCGRRSFRPGDAWAWQAPDGLVVYNLATQDLPGRHADLAYVGASVSAMLADAERRSLAAVAVPRLGAGIGGLRWRDVRPVLEASATRSAVELVIVSRTKNRTSEHHDERDDDRDELEAMSRDELLAFAQANGYPVRPDGTKDDVVAELLDWT